MKNDIKCSREHFAKYMELFFIYMMTCMSAYDGLVRISRHDFRYDCCITICDNHMIQATISVSPELTDNERKPLSLHVSTTVSDTLAFMRNERFMNLICKLLNDISEFSNSNLWQKAVELTWYQSESDRLLHEIVELHMKKDAQLLQWAVDGTVEENMKKAYEEINRLTALKEKYDKLLKEN